MTAHSEQLHEAKWIVSLRTAAFAVGAAFITAMLLWMMQYLIATGVEAVTEERTFRFVDFVRVQRDERVQTREDKVERVRDAEPPPLVQRERHIEEGDALAVGVIGVSAPRVSHETNLGRDGFFSDGEYMPIVQVAPQYPARAASMNLEGYVILEFTVTSEGTVRDPRVIESSHQIFERAAVDAVLRFRYRPRVIDGAAVEVPGVRFRITFQLTDS